MGSKYASDMCIKTMTIFCSINQKRVITFIICRREKNTITTFPYTIKEWRKFVNLYYINFLKTQYWYLQHLLPRACLVIAWKVSKYGPEKTPYMDNFLIVFLIEIKLLTRLNLGLSYFRQNNFKKDIVNPLCCCSLEVEPTSNFSLQCQTWNTFANV